MASPKSELPQGTLDLLVLKVVALGPLHGWGIAKKIQVLSDEELSVGQGSLYPALHRLEHQGWIDAEWSISELGRRAKYYKLTPSGRRQHRGWRPGTSRTPTGPRRASRPQASARPATRRAR